MPFQKLMTLGRIAVRLERSYAQIENLPQGLGISPCLQLNDIVYYDQAAEIAIDSHCREVEAERILKGKK